MRTRSNAIRSAGLLFVLAGCGAKMANESSAPGALDAGGASGDASQPELPRSPLVVTTQHGQLEGVPSGGARAFLGIPFASPPIGQRRWRAAELPAPWGGVRKADAYGSSCAQTTPSGSAYDTTSSEDCLYLNVWTPMAASAAKLPVMVWIYGGAYVFGSGGPPYNGESLVERGNVIVVTMNYRLGALGYMAHPGLSAEADQYGGARANFGMLDQRLALEWVRDNIAAFGGDENNVTLFGESAGANSVSAHLLSEGSWGLFERAIIQSGSVMKPALTLAEAEAQGARLAAAVGCTQSDAAAALACLRALPAEQVTKRTGGWAAAGGIFYQLSGRGDLYMPVIDGQTLKEQVESAFAAGHVSKVPVLHGVTADEGVLFHIGIFGDRPPANLAEYRAAVENRVGAAGVARVVERYPDYATGLTEISADAVYRCPAARMAKYLGRHGFTQYLYRFDARLAVRLPALADKAFHSADVPYVFGNPYLLGRVPEESFALSDLITGYWTRFATTGDPNSEGAAKWNPYTETNTAHLNLATPISQSDDLAEGCELWGELPISAP